MTHLELLTIMGIVAFAGVIFYRLSFFHRRRWGYFSLVQTYYLIVMPGIMNTIIYSEVFDIISRPKNGHIILGDKFLLILLFLSTLFTYLGVVIHGVTKTLDRYFTPDQRNTKVYEVSEYFHWDFSHNMIYSGAVITALIFALLELNHISPNVQPVRLFWLVVTGVMVGTSSVFMLINYERRNHMRLFFVSFWVALVAIFYMAKPFIRDIDQYPVTAIILIAFAILAIFNLFFYVRIIKGKWRLVFKIPKKLFRRHKVKSFEVL